MTLSLVRCAYQYASSYGILLSRSVLYRTVATAPLPATSESSINEEKTQPKENETIRGTSSKGKDVETEKKAKISNSFVMNLFRGQFYPQEVFPYPNILNEEQKDNVQMLIEPITKFLEEKNDPAKNDQLEKVFVFSTNFSIKTKT